MAQQALHDSALGTISIHKGIWEKAHTKYKTYSSELEYLEAQQEQGFEAKKLANKISDLKSRVLNQKFLKDTAKKEISILEQMNWKKDLTDQSDESVSKVKDIPEKANEQNKSAHFKKKLLYA
jgi:ppGpp synthetase/RelA/SpoT-type nucleotidyltranferase